MKVSIVILNYFHPEIIEICLRTLRITEEVEYEVIVVDNGSDPTTISQLETFKKEGLIDKLILSPVNTYFSEGNNIGVANADPTSEYILLLNSDVGFIRPDWLTKAFAWMDGTIKYEPTVWHLHPTQPKAGPRDIISIGWSHDAAVLPSRARPEGWCCLIRKSVWRDMSLDFPYYYGFEEMIANTVRDGAKIGVLCNYAKYLVHAEQGSGNAKIPAVNKRTPNIPGWFSGLDIETLDFTLGPNEHQSYLQW